MRIIVTGGSGFIGTNMVQYYLDKGWDVLNLSRSKPRNVAHGSCWREVSVGDYEGLRTIIVEFTPDYIIHLAGRTDLEGKRLEDYTINIEGTRNIIEVAKVCPSLKKIILTSSALVCKPRYVPNNERAYSSINYYGLSKANAEETVWNDPPACDWSIVRPTSIWGPWQTTSYVQFFKTILAGHYFHIGKCSSRKTFGYVGNMVYQMDALLHTDTKDVNKKVFYLGDYEPYDIFEWADEIAAFSGSRLLKMPYGLAKCGAIAGDVLNTLGVRFPLTSQRLKNMRTNSILDLRDIQEIAHPLPFTREAGVKETIKWIQNN